MIAVPMSQREARAFVRELHRHNIDPQGDRFRVAAQVGGRIVGVVMVGDPRARMLRDGYTAEVTRLCTVGTDNLCSFLYGRAKQAARALGFRKLVTYTLPREGGASLRAAGFRFECETKAEGWDRPGRARTDKHDVETRWRWGVYL